MTSRPERHIESILVPSNNHLRTTALHDIEASIVTGDIRLYLRAQLFKLGAEYDPPLPSDWITEVQIDFLAEKAGNLFILASTAVRFLFESLDPQSQLGILLEALNSTHGISPGSNPFHYLDNLYLGILLAMISPTNRKEVIACHQTVLGSIVLLRDPLPIGALQRLLGPHSTKASSILPFLHSVILPPLPPDNCPRVYHPSFAEFLQDENRCTDERFLINNKKQETRMVLRCLVLINCNLHKGMLGVMDPALLNSEVAGIEGRVKAAFPLELRYACRFWPAHFLAAVRGEVDPEILEAFDTFAAKSLVPWVEAMSWLGDLRLCLASLESINSWAYEAPSAQIFRTTANTFLPMRKVEKGVFRS